MLVRLGFADADPSLAEALDRWELSLFQHDPFSSGQVRASLAALLGDTWPLRAAVLLEDDPPTRRSLHTDLAALAAGTNATPAAVDAARRALIEGLRHHDRAGLIRDLDDELLGLHERRSARLAV